MGRFINADAYTSTGQGILGNNMFAYCNNNPVNSSDSHGYFTISIGICVDGYAFVGASVGIAIAFDSAGNIEVQESYSVPTERETTSIGLLHVGVAGFFQITNKSDVSELTNVSTYLGLSDPSPVGVDLVLDAPVADPGGDLVGIQFSQGKGAGVDVHVAQTYTKTRIRFVWRDVLYWINKVFEP